jgi:DNA ligase-1
MNYPSGEVFSGNEHPSGENFRAPMLWHTWTGADIAGWLISEKLDGVRALWDGATLRTRTGAAIPAPQALLSALPGGTMLDGELYAGPGTLQRVHMAVRGRTNDWSGVRFHVFDAPGAGGGFAGRMARAAEVVRGRGPLVAAVPHQPCLGHRWLAARFAEVRAAGGEGLVARMPDAPYRWGLRDGQTLKIKARPDSPLLLAAA